MNKLYIPDKLKIGFKDRKDTYTHKLGFVIYYDEKGGLKKQLSWESWRDKNIEPIECNNEPIEGFVLNKNVGGTKYGWNYRSEYVRVYDPRDFEIEITIANLLFILKECDCSRGKGLEGQFVYAWAGQRLILLPVSCEEYSKSKNFTNLQSKKIETQEMKKGLSYLTKSERILTYIGRMDYYYLPSGYKTEKELKKEKRHVFWDGNYFTYTKDLKHIAAINSDEIAQDYANIVDKYYKLGHGSKLIKIYLKDTDRDSNCWTFEESPGVYVNCMTAYSWDKSRIDYIRLNEKVTFINNKLEFVFISEYLNGYSNFYYSGNYPNVKPTGKALYGLLESGSEVLITSHTFN